MYLGMDCGTQGTKALLIDRDGTALGRGYASHALIEDGTGTREQDPAWWVDALRLSVQQALTHTSRRDVEALGVSGQQHGLVVLDERHQVIRPAKLWNDTATAPQNQQLIDMLGGKQAWFERFGIVPRTGYTVSKLLWLKQNEPANFSRIRHILLPHEYLNFWLTGRLCAEYGDASGTAFFNVRTRLWSREILDVIDGGTGQLYSALPPLIPVEQPVGTLRPGIAAELGLPASCLVSAGGGDNMMGAIGTGNVRPGVVTLSLGTSSTVYSYADAPSLDPSGNVASFCSSTGGWLPLVCTMNATNVVTQTLHLLGRSVGDIEAAMAATSPTVNGPEVNGPTVNGQGVNGPGADGLVFLPFLNGERTPDLPHAQGTILGLSARNFTPDHLIRAALEGVSFGILHGLDLIRHGAPADHMPADHMPADPMPADRMLVIGGGSRSAAWCQLLADATGASVEVPLEAEAGCFGAAIQAIYLHQSMLGAPESFLSLTDRCVRVDHARSARPTPHLQAAYRKARERYATSLAKIYLRS